MHDIQNIIKLPYILLYMQVTLNLFRSTAPLEYNYATKGPC